MRKKQLDYCAGKEWKRVYGSENLFLRESGVCVVIFKNDSGKWGWYAGRIDRSGDDEQCKPLLNVTRKAPCFEDELDAQIDSYKGFVAASGVVKVKKIDRMQNVFDF